MLQKSAVTFTWRALGRCWWRPVVAASCVTSRWRPRGSAVTSCKVLRSTSCTPPTLLPSFLGPAAPTLPASCTRPSRLPGSRPARDGTPGGAPVARGSDVTSPKFPASSLNRLARGWIPTRHETLHRPAVDLLLARRRGHEQARHSTCCVRDNVCHCTVQPAEGLMAR